ncbi:MAG: thioredoxin TrxC [Gammaproteobacteria bacterium]
MSDAIHIPCPHCHGVNRVPRDRDPLKAHCGRCKQDLFTAKPLALDEASFATHVERGDIPVVVDFWAAWCGPCQMMAPGFEAAAAEIEPRARLAKVDTEANQGLSLRFQVRSIPTLIIFRQGRESARVSGALSQRDLVGWINQNI